MYFLFSVCPLPLECQIEEGRNFVSPPRHPIAITGPGIEEVPPWRHRGVREWMKRASSCRDCTIEASGRGDESTKSLRQEHRWQIWGEQGGRWPCRRESQGDTGRCQVRAQRPDHKGPQRPGGKLALSFNLIGSHRKVWRRVTWSDSYFSKVLLAAGAECTEGGRQGGREQLEAVTVVPGRDQEGRESFPEGAVVQLIWKDG